MLGLMAVALMMTAMAGMVGQVMVARHRVQAAADLAALAGAAAWSAAGGDACRTAGRIASGNSARLTSCVIGGDGTVRTQASVPVGVHWTAHAAARAGPANQAPAR